MRASVLLASVLAVCAGVLPSAVLGWGDTGHSLTARLAMSLFSDATVQLMKEIVPEKNGNISEVTQRASLAYYEHEHWLQRHSTESEPEQAAAANCHLLCCGALRRCKLPRGQIPSAVPPVPTPTQPPTTRVRRTVDSARTFELCTAHSVRMSAACPTTDRVLLTATVCGAAPQ